MTPPYVELQCTSNFSFLRGASHPEELVVQAAALGYGALAITDFNSLAGVVRAHVQAKESGLRLVIGARLTPDDGPALLVYPTDRAAYGRLARLITLGRRRVDKGQCRLMLADILEHAEGQIAVVLPPNEIGSIGVDARRAYGALRDTFSDQCYLAAACLYGPEDRAGLCRLRDLSRATGLPLVATNDVHYHVPERRILQDVLVCIREICTIGEAGYRLFPNAERYLKPPEEMARLFADDPEAVARTVEIAQRCAFSLDELRYEYPDELAPAGLTPMQYLTQLAWDGAREKFPDGLPEPVRKQIEHELELIAELRYEAYFLTVYDIVRFARRRGILCQGRGSAANSAVCYCIGITSVDPGRIDVLFERFVSKERDEPPDIDVDFEHERREEVIQYIYGKYGRERAGLTAEVITYRPRSAIRDVGKALGLSLDAVDQLARTCDWWDKELPPQRLAGLGLNPRDPTVRMAIRLSHEILNFPRHLSQHVGGFVMTRGPLCEMVPIENAAMADRTVIEWNKDDIDALGLLKVDVLGLGMLTCIQKAFQLIEGTEARRHEGTEGREERSTDGGRGPHSSGPDSKPRACCYEIKINAASAHPSCLRASVPSCLQLHTIPPEDPAVYDMICNADTVGVFQIESRAQMTMLPRLRPRDFYDLVIEVAIVRPGPIQGDMVHPYLRRRAGEEPVTYPNEAVRGVLQKTLGVPLFQEQVMKLAVVAAGFTPGEADQLRRAMAAWKRQGIIDRFQRKFIEGMLANGYDESFAERLFDQIRGFGEYGFPESHAASFALLVYVSAWLKRYQPAAFAAALINSQPMGFYAPAQIIRDARAHGVEVRPVDVNYSDWDCTLEERHADTRARRHAGRVGESPAEWGMDGPAIRLGMRVIKGLPEAQARGLVQMRSQGQFDSVGEMARRAALGRGVLIRLARADAMRSLGLDRRAALWEVMKEHAPAQAAGAESPSPATPLSAASGDPERAGSEFRRRTQSRRPRGARPAPRTIRPVPTLFDALDAVEPQVRLPEMPIGQQVAHDYVTTGLSLKKHPVELIREALLRERAITAGQLLTTPTGRWVRMAGLVICRQRPDTASGVVFVTLEDETGAANLIVRSDVYERYRAAIRHATLLWVEGRVEGRGQVIHVLVNRAEDRSDRLPGVPVASHDFH